MSQVHHAAALALCAVFVGGAVRAEIAVPPAIAAAVADPARPPLDRFRDARRKPAQTVAFAGVHAGETVAELIPGNGYYTLILARAVGPSGKVYTLPFSEPRAAASRAIAADPNYPNVKLVAGSPFGFGIPEKVDLVWTTQNYHDIRQGRTLLNKAVFEALKPGGTYFIVDHAAKPGSDESVLLSLHRIDEDLVKKEVIAAGFVLEAQSDLLRNPRDDRTRLVFDRELNRDTDQFVLRFRKPAQ